METNMKNLIENLPSDLKDYFESLPSDIKDKAMNATSIEELKEIVGPSMRELTDEELDAISGGCSTEVYGDVREDFDSSKMSASFLSGEDLGF